MNRDIVEQILRDYGACHHPGTSPGTSSGTVPGTDPELEAVRAAIMLEDVFGIALSDAEIDPAVLAGSAAVAAVVLRKLPRKAAP